MPRDSSDLSSWPRRPDGRRWRSGAPSVIAASRRIKPHRPLGWTFKLFVLFAVAAPSYFLASPAYADYVRNLPDPTGLLSPIPEDTLVYASDATTLLADLHPPGHQSYYESLADMGTLLPEAVISIEDHGFYEEPGLDVQAILRAAIADSRAHSAVQGASTITQQLVKLRLVGNETTLDRKIREALVSFQVERTYSKDQILEWYLNSVFFGNTASGSAAASLIFFHKATKNLDLAEASMLAGLIRGPSLYDPLTNWKSAKARQQTVLDAMVRDGKITKAQAAKAYAEDISPPKHMFTPANVITFPDFVSYTTAQLIQQFGADATYSGGLRVVTTLNVTLQQIAQSTVSSNIMSLSKRRVTQGALVAIDPTTGAILSMVGSANPKGPGGLYNLAVWPPRNPGSSMKIFTYTAAIASGKFTMTTPISDSAFAYRVPGSTEVYAPRNYDGRYHGTCQLQACMGNSLNIPAVKVELGIGVASVVKMARAMGAPPYQLHYDASGNPLYTTDDALNTYGPSLTLGAYGETPLQMATGASVLATQGLLRQPYVVNLVMRSGRLLYAHTVDPGKRVLDARVAFIMEQIMSNDNNRAMIFGRNSLLTLPGRRVAVKTGTSDSFADAWTVGYTPHLVVAVWGGNADWRTKMTLNSDSYYIAAPMWHSFMQKALDALHLPNEWYSQPSGLVTRTVAGQTAYYLPGTQGR